MSRSAILLPNWIGDLLLALSVVERLPLERRAETTMLVPKKMGALVSLLSDLPQIPFDRRDKADRKRTLGAVRAAGFGSIALLPYSFSSAWFAFRAGIPVRRGLAKEMRGPLLTERLPGKLRDKTKHITREYSEILRVPFREPEAWGGKAVPADERYRGVMVYCPGAAYGPAKRWPHFAALARLQKGERIVVLGTAADKESAQEVVAAAPGRVEDLTGKTSLVEAAGVMAAAKAVVSNDSGLMHLAGFIGTPLVGLFGSTSPVWTRPLGRRNIIMQPDEPCAPCFERTCRYGHYRCQMNITPAAVARALEEAGEVRS